MSPYPRPPQIQPKTTSSGSLALILSPPFELTVGGLCYHVTGSDGLEVSERDPCYTSFLPPANQQASAPRLDEVGLPVEIRLDEAPDLNGATLLFDTGEAWSAHQHSTDLFLRMRGPGHGPESYQWIAQLPKSLTSVVLHCSERLVEERQPNSIRLANPLRYPLDQLLTSLVLAPRDGLIVHGAGLVARHGDVTEDQAIVFAGVSGAGKTTFMGLCADEPELAGLSDDRIILRHSTRHHATSDILAFGTPWAGEGRVAVHRSAGLRAVCFLQHADRDRLRTLTSRDALERLLPVTSIPWFLPRLMEPALSFCERLVEEVPFFELGFRPESNGGDLVRRVLAAPLKRNML